MANRVHIIATVSGPSDGVKWHSLCSGPGGGVMYIIWAGAGGEQSGAGLWYTRGQRVDWGRE